MKAGGEERKEKSRRAVRIMMWEQVGQSRSKERKIKESKVRKVAADLAAHYRLQPLKTAVNYA